jgi:hypothetical protein
VPYLGIWYALYDDDSVRQYAPIVCNALAWAIRFRRTKPDWAPELPMNIEDIEKLRASGSRRMRQLGDYALALMIALWAPRCPTFDEYCNGADVHWPDDEAVEGWERLQERTKAGLEADGRLWSCVSSASDLHALEQLDSSVRLYRSTPSIPVKLRRGREILRLSM